MIRRYIAKPFRFISVAFAVVGSSVSMFFAAIADEIEGVRDEWY